MLARTILTVLLACMSQAAPAADVPLTPTEQLTAVKLTRLRGVRIWWNDENRIIGVALKGVNATDQTVQLASRLPLLRSLVLVAVRDQSLTDAGIAALRNANRLEVLFIVGSDVTDRGLQNIAALPRLRVLVLKGQFTDDAFDVIAQLHKLEFLDMTQTRVTDAGLKRLTALKKLQTLILNGTSVTDAGVEAISRIGTLRWLYLGDTPVDDKAIDSLTRLQGLNELYVSGTQISKKGFQTLRSAMSTSCEIYFGDKVYRGTRAQPAGVAVATTP